MKEIIYNFITGLKELSKKYNFDGVLYVDLSPSSFKLCNDETEFHIHTKAENFTAMMICNLLDEMEELLKKVRYPNDLKYYFSISSCAGTIIHNLFNDSYEPIMANRQPNKIEFSCDNIKEEQFYMLSVDRGEIRLEKYNDDEEEHFKENPDVIYFLNTFIDNKIPNSIANIKFTQEEYETVEWAMLIADEKLSELITKHPNATKIEQLIDHKQNLVEIIRKVRNLTTK